MPHAHLDYMGAREKVEPVHTVVPLGCKETAIKQRRFAAANPADDGRRIGCAAPCNGVLVGISGTNQEN
jgi:hypothetical protein